MFWFDASLKKKRSAFSGESHGITFHQNDPRPHSLDLKEDRSSFIWVQPLILCIVIGAAYLPSLWHGFNYDDYVVLVDNSFIRSPSNLSKIFSTDYFNLSGEDSYRPVLTLSYFLDWALHKASASGSHAINVILHIAATLAAYFLLCNLGLFRNSSRWIAAAAAAFWGLHPMMVEVAASPGNRDEDLVAMLGFAAWGLILKAFSNELRPKINLEIKGLLCFIAALFSHEFAVVMPIAVAVGIYLAASGDSIRKLKRALFVSAPMFLFSFLYFVGRMFVFKPVTGISTVIEGGRFSALMMFLIKILPTYFALTLFPVGLRTEWKFESITGTGPENLVWLTIVIVLLIAMAVFFIKGKRWTFFPMVFIIFLLPVSNVIFPFWISLAERFWTLAGIGASVAFGLCIVKLAENRPKAALGVSFAVLSVLLILTEHRLWIWGDQIRLWSDCVKKSPLSSRCYINLAIAKLRSNDLTGTEELAAKAVKISGNTPANLLFFSRVLRGNGKAQEADELLGRYCTPQGEYEWLCAELAKAATDEDNLDKAIVYYQKALEGRPDHVEALIGLALVYMKQREYQRALDLAQKVLAMDSCQPDALQVRGFIRFQEQKDLKGALIDYGEMERCTQNPEQKQLASQNAQKIKGLLNR